MSPCSYYGKILWKFNNQEEDAGTAKLANIPVQSILDIVNAFDSTGKTWNIHITGGEPFKYPNFVELCYMLSKTHLISIDSRLSCRDAMLFAEHIPPSRVQLIKALFHPKLQSDTKKMKEFIDSVKFFINRNFNVHVEYLLYPPLHSRIFRDLILLDSNGISKVHLKMFRGKVQGKTYPSAYSIESKNLLRRYAEVPGEIDILENRKHFFGKACSAGVDYFRMDKLGNLHRCMNSSVSYGNLFDRTFIMDNDPRPCPFHRCHCVSEGLHCAKDNVCSSSILLKEIAREYSAKLTYRVRVMS